MSIRSALVRSLPCICCEQNNARRRENGERELPQLLATQEHHCNAFELAGKKRLGDAYSLPLCEYHHVGTIPMGFTATQMLCDYGPSLARNKTKFREVFHSDVDLLAATNAQLAQLLPAMA